MIELKKLFDLQYPITDYRVTKIKINPEPLKLEDHKFYFIYEETYKVEKKILGLFKKTKRYTERYSNVVVSGGSSDVLPVAHFNNTKCIPGETVLNLNAYFNISGECLISKEQNQDGSYDLTKLPNIELEFGYIGGKCPSYNLSDRVSFRNKEDLTKLLKYLVDSHLILEESYQNKETTELITDIYKYIKNYIKDGK